MGYTTEFNGVLKFKKGLTVEALAKLNTFMGEDIRRHPEWNSNIELTRINLEIIEDFSGIRRNGGEKFYDIVEKLELIMKNMWDAGFKDFGLNGKLQAQGEEFDDRWILIAKDDTITTKKLVIEGAIECPHCGDKFIPE